MVITEVLQNVVDALSLGALYAVTALGIGVIFGIMRLVNFAHGELIMLSAYTVAMLYAAPLVVAIAAALVVAAGTALLMERLAFRPIRRAPPATLMVTSFALSYTLQNVAVVVMGAHAKTVALPGLGTGAISLGGVRVGRLPVVTLVVALLLLVLLGVFLRKTSLGLQMRAAAEDFEMATLVGVRANSVIAVAFVLSGLLAGVVAVLLLAQTGTVNPVFGVAPLLVGVVAIVVGGIGSLPGAVVGGFLLGALTVGLQVVLPLSMRPFRDAITFGSVILILLLRPQGLFPASTDTRA